MLQGFQELSVGRTIIGIKRMGELDPKAFGNACKKSLSKDDAELVSATLCSKWDAEIRNPNWHPFRVVVINEKATVQTPFTVAFLLP
jgi:hypothetical protein